MARGDLVTVGRDFPFPSWPGEGFKLPYRLTSCLRSPADV